MPRPSVLATVGGLLIGSLITRFVLPGLENFTITTLIYVTAVVGLYAFIGNSGIISFGHIGFMSLGAYATSLLVIPVAMKSFDLPDLPGIIASAELPTVVALALGMLFCAVVAAVIGVGIMRLNGIAASISMLAFLIIVNVVINQADSITGGNQTLPGIPFFTTYTLVLGAALVSIAIAYLFSQSSYGKQLRATREDEFAADSLGINRLKVRIMGLSVSAALVGLAGGLYAGHLGTISSDTFYLEMTFLTLAMLIIGGRNRLEGAVVGTVIVAITIEVLRRFESGQSVAGLEISLPQGSTNIGLALIVLAILFIRPMGILDRTGESSSSGILKRLRLRLSSSPGPANR